MTSSNGNIFRVTGTLCGEFTGDRWIPRTKATDAELWCSLWSAPWINGWVNNREAGDLRRHRAHYDVIIMVTHNSGRCIFAIGFVHRADKTSVSVVLIWSSLSWTRVLCMAEQCLSQWEKKPYTCNVFSHWLRPCPVNDRQRAQFPYWFDQPLLQRKQWWAV